MKKLSFKKEFAPDDYKRIEKVIYLFFKNHFGRVINGKYFYNFRSLDNILGTAYTSTGIYAIYGICNVEIYFDAENKLKIEMFCIDIDNNIYCELWDAEENPYYIKIS